MARDAPAGHTPPRIPRRARVQDLPAVLALEEAAFEPARRSSIRSLTRSLASPHQSFLVLDKETPEDPPLTAILILWHRKASVRVYDVAVHPACRGRGLMRVLMDHAEAIARERLVGRVVLEASVDGDLVRIYERFGYRVVEHLPDYYGKGLHAARLEKRV